MQSKNYARAQSMVLLDKYNMSKDAFAADLAELARRYFEVDAITEEAFSADGLQIVLTLSVKKVKIVKRVLA